MIDEKVLKAAVLAVVGSLVSGAVWAAEVVPQAVGTELVFDLSEDGSYSQPIGAGYTKVTKRGVGKLTISRGDETLDAFVGDVVVEKGRLCLPHLPNIGKPKNIDVQSGATLDVSGCTANSGYLNGALLTLAGTGDDATSGAFVCTSINSGNYDALLKSVKLLGDTTVTVGARMGISNGELDLNGFNLTKKGTGVFEISKYGKIVGDGNIIMEGQITLETCDLTAGDPTKNKFVMKAALDWWDSKWDKPINWAIENQTGSSISVGAVGNGFDSGRRWSGPIVVNNDKSFTLNVNQRSGTATLEGDVTVDGEFYKGNPGSLRVTAQNVTAGTNLTVAAGYMQFAPKSEGAVYAFAGRGQVNGGTLECFLTTNSVMSFGSKLNFSEIDGLIAFHGGTYTSSGTESFAMGGNNRNTHFVLSDGAVYTPPLHFYLGYNPGSRSDLTLTGAGTKLWLRNATSKSNNRFYVSNSGNSTGVVNVVDGAVLSAARFRTGSETLLNVGFFVNVDGGVFMPLYAWGWNDSGTIGDPRAPTVFTVYEGGCTFDTSEVNGNTFGEIVNDGSTITWPIVKPGDGKRIVSIGFPADSPILTNRYSDVPPVVITGAGAGASAYLDVDPVTRIAKGVVIAAKGWGYAEGTTATVLSPDRTATYDLTVTLGDTPSADAAEWKGLTKRGQPYLVLRDANTYLGPTTVEEGTLSFDKIDARPLGSGLIVAKGAVVRFAQTDQSQRPIPFVRGSGRLYDFKDGTTAVINRIEVTTDQLAKGEFLTVETFQGSLVLPEGAVVKVLDPENLDAGTFKKTKFLQATALTLPTAGLAGVTLDVGAAKGEWRLSQSGGSLSIYPRRGLVLLVK